MALNMGVKHPPQVVHHPLADAGCQVFFGVRAESPDCGDDERTDGGKLYESQLIGTECRQNEIIEPSMHWTVTENVVQYKFQRPRLQKIRKAFPGNRKYRKK